MRFTPRHLAPLLLGSALLLGGCTHTVRSTPPPTYADYNEHLPCVARIGRCFDATVGGQPVEVIAEKVRYEQMNAAAHAANAYVRNVYWEVREPVDGKAAFDIQVTPNAIGLSMLGQPGESAETLVFPLDDQKLASRPVNTARDDVKVNGQAIVTQQNVLTEDYLPPGRYVLAINYAGTLNWDRKFVFVTVR